MTEGGNCPHTPRVKTSSPPIPVPQLHAILVPVPSSDRLSGVAARRDRRRARGDDVNLHTRGLQKMVFPWRHGARPRVSDRPLTAAARNRAPGASVRRGRAAGPDVFAGQSCPSESFGKPAIENARALAQQRDCSYGQKPPNGAPEGVTYLTPTRQLPAPRPSWNDTVPRRVSRAWPKAVGHGPISSLEGKMSVKPTEGGKLSAYAIAASPPSALSGHLPLKGGDRTQPAIALFDQGMQSHVR